MKKFRLLITVILFSALYAHGQKSNVQAAFNFLRYGQLDKAKEAIDEATLNEKSSTMEKTWYYRGIIYQSLYQDEKFGSLCVKCLDEAYKSYQKVLELAPRSDLADSVKNFQLPGLAASIFSLGVSEFNKKNYAEALADFEFVQKIYPNDTATLNAAFSAEYVPDKDKAILYYSRLVAKHYPDYNIYVAVANLYSQRHENEKALQAIQEGKKLYGDTLKIILAEINLLLAMNHKEEAVQEIQTAIKKDSLNTNLYVVLGNTFDNLAHPKDSAGNELAKPASFTEYYSKAESSYLKGISISPNNFELNFNLGAMYFNEGAEMANAAIKIKTDADFARAKVEYEKRFKAAEPLLEKAMALNPRQSPEDQNIYQGTLQSLKTLYARLNEKEKYEQIEKLLSPK